MAGLFVGAEDMRRLGGPGPTAGDAVHQTDQSEVALVQISISSVVSGRPVSAARARNSSRVGGLFDEFIQILPVPRACNQHAASVRAQATEPWPAPCITPVRVPPDGRPHRGALNVQAPSHRRRRPRFLRCDCHACLCTGHSAHRHDSRRHSPNDGPARPGLRRLSFRRLHDLRRAGELGPVEGRTSPTSSPASPPNGRPSGRATKWIFKLRQGVKFHDGTDFDADVVVWNLEKILNDKSPQFDPKQAAQSRRASRRWSAGKRSTNTRSSSRPAS